MSILAPYWPADLVQLARDQFILDPKGHHGLPHWTRVGHHAVELAQELGLDPTVPALFALFHDSCRENEHDDDEHGMRASDFVGRLIRRGKFDHLSSEQKDHLRRACAEHSLGLTHGPLVVQVCFDADRLDLGRVGIRPDCRLLCTDAAQDPARLRRAERWSEGYTRGGVATPALKRKWAMR